ncbi:MAG TPA: cbb3-type cytochrome oxidase assembly protein CcoS [Acetobacteraceae bacterium]|jgi:cbb3-type cytochrome oxidase maturation protein
MNVILYLLAASLLLGGGGLALFLWSLRSGQYDDMDGAAQRILFDDEPNARRSDSDEPTVIARSKNQHLPSP